MQATQLVDPTPLARLLSVLVHRASARVSGACNTPTRRRDGDGDGRRTTNDDDDGDDGDDDGNDGDDAEWEAAL